MLLVIRRVWTALLLLVVFGVMLPRAAEFWSTDAPAYLAFLIGAVWAPVAFVLTMAQQATGRSSLFKDEQGF